MEWSQGYRVQVKFNLNFRYQNYIRVSKLLKQEVIGCEFKELLRPNQQLLSIRSRLTKQESWAEATSVVLCDRTQPRYSEKIQLLQSLKEARFELTFTAQDKRISSSAYLFFVAKVDWRSQLAKTLSVLHAIKNVFFNSNIGQCRKCKYLYHALRKRRHIRVLRSLTITDTFRSRYEIGPFLKASSFCDRIRHPSL